jgi:hypothetical protein
MKSGNTYERILAYLAIALMVAMIAVAFFCSCKQVEYVTVPEVHTEYHHTTDSVRQVDSIIDHQTTVIREVDSATMAQYGIQLASAQRAWLIQNERLMREIQQLRESKSDTLVVRDSIPYPVPKTEYVKYVPKSVKILAWIGGTVLLGLVGWLAIFIIKKFRKTGLV